MGIPAPAAIGSGLLAGYPAPLRLIDLLDVDEPVPRGSLYIYEHPYQPN